MRRYRATLAYDGTAYSGYQIQPNQPTIQGEVEAALAKVLGRHTRVWAAGRTDTGVHATGQVIAFDAAWRHCDNALLRALNANLPDDIALQAVQQQPNFHPRFDALSRTYRYQIAVVDVRQPLLLKRAWQLYQTVDVPMIQQAAALLIGEHDFAAFGNAPQGDNTVREIFQSRWQMEAQPQGYSLFYEVEATAFLHHMVRRLVGMQIALGQGKIALKEFEAIFHRADLACNKWVAPPQGLTLLSVRYPSAITE